MVNSILKIVLLQSTITEKLLTLLRIRSTLKSFVSMLEYSRVINRLKESDLHSAIYDLFEGKNRTKKGAKVCPFFS